MTDALGVSIVIANYNNESFLAAAIDSALNQDHPLCEVIVVDDASTDNSRAVIARYKDRIRSMLRDTNGHQTVALNSGWPLARYPILFFSTRTICFFRVPLQLLPGAGRLVR